ncbi:MAG: hypothetical protein ABI662_10840 [Dermatophilaceae bacterium]
MTLEQLAALWRGHAGAAGQAFELAVVEAVNHGIPEVVVPLVESLRLLGIHDTQPPRMMVLGLEKVPVDQRDAAVATIAALLPDGAGLRTGLPGRPLQPQAVATRMMDSWPDQSRAAGEPAPRGDEKPHGVTDELRDPDSFYTEQSQLARADALLYTNRAMVPVSMKINQKEVQQGSARHGWRDVPLWITRAPKCRSATSVYKQPSAKVTMVVVELADNRWTRCFETALTIIESVLVRVDRGRATPASAKGFSSRDITSPAALAYKRLVRQANRPIESITEELRRGVHPSVELSMRSLILATPIETSLPAVDELTLMEAWQAEAAGGGIYRGPHHLFFQGDRSRG